MDLLPLLQSKMYSFPEEPIISLSDSRPIIPDVPLELFIINIRPIIITKIFTATAPPTCPPTLSILTSNMIIFFLEINLQQSEVTAKTWNFSDQLGMKARHIYLNFCMWCEIIFIATTSMMIMVTHKFPTKKREQLSNSVRFYIGKWVVQNIRY